MGAGVSEALAEAVARVWPDGLSTWEVLGGGITNHNVKVTRPDGVVVLRVAGKDTDLLGIDRTVELAATRAAAEAGIGPEVDVSSRSSAGVLPQSTASAWAFWRMMASNAGDEARREASSASACAIGAPGASRDTRFTDVEDWRSSGGPPCST